ncbi:hypothetical protein ISP15_16910 [Dyella jejuensis]|uniref:Bacteriocin class II with double-glycine leader peptide n=1 Tax=Dyella jejuensis TaxID=1432009 RepID=A0ABW8JP55_9GAMM
MQELTINEVELVSGSMTTNQCIGVYAIVGGVTGGVAGAFLGAGIGAFGGSSFGLAVGGAFGMIVCN